MNRRWFIKVTASAAIALTAARILPVSALPRVGRIHGDIHDRVLRWLRAEFNAHVRTHGRAPWEIRAGAALYQNYEAALNANERFMSGTTFDSWLFFKGVTFREDTSIGPWMVEMAAHV